MSELSPQAQRFLNDHLFDGTPSGEQRSRVRTAALLALAAPAAALAGAGVAAATSSASASAAGAGATATAIGFGTKAAVLAVSVAVGGVVAVPVVRWVQAPQPSHVVKHAAPPAPRAARQPALVAAPVEDAPPPLVEAELPPAPPPPGVPRARVAPVVAEPEPVAAEPAPVAAAAVAPRAEPMRSDARLSDEVRLLGTAQAALRDGKAQEALGLLDEHDNFFKGAARLQEEVHVARIGALCALGRVEDARAQFALLESRWPSSVHLDRVRDACW